MLIFTFEHYRKDFFFLGPNKIKFIPQLVGPILEMTLIPETGK